MKQFGQFYDGWFNGLLIDERCVLLFLSTDQKEKFVLTANGVSALAVDGLASGNIIFDIEQRATEELTHRDIRDVFRIAGPEEESYTNIAFLKAKEAGLSLLIINPSCGGRCVLLGESFELAKSGTPGF